MKYNDIMKEDTELIRSLYKRCQTAYYRKFGVYYYYGVSTGYWLRKTDMASRLSELCNETYGGWNNGYVINEDRYCGQMIIVFESLTELDLKLTVNGF